MINKKLIATLIILNLTLAVTGEETGEKAAPWKFLNRLSLIEIYSGAGEEHTFEIVGIQPDKIFTPKTEYTNYIEFKYVNPKEARVTGKIYDLTGAEVANMERGDTGTVGDRSGSFRWDGKYDDGIYASGGVYIYQFEVTGAEEKVVNGTVVIGR